jgi:hypothetical protein
MDSDDAIDNLVATRIERHGVITGESPPLLWYVVDESVVRHVVGGPGVMAVQLDRLLEASTEPGIVLQVLPYAADNHAGAEGPISLYEFAESPSVCYTECYGGGRIVESREEVANLMTVISLIRAAALSERESRALIQQIRTEMMS